MKIKPLGDRIAIKQFQAEEKTKSGIILTVATKEKPPVFEVVEVADGKMTDGTTVKMIFKKGDKVVCNKFAGLSFTVDEEEVTIIRQGDIQATIKD